MINVDISLVLVLRRGMIEIGVMIESNLHQLWEIPVEVLTFRKVLPIIELMISLSLLTTLPV